MEAFAEGCGGRTQYRGQWRPGPAAIYGVKRETLDIWAQIRKGGFRWFYIDNAYFGFRRFYRVTEGSIQHTGVGRPDHSRLDVLGVEFKPWRAAGKHILVCEQSDDFMRLVCGLDPDEWRRDVVSTLRAHTDRLIVHRRKNAPAPLNRDLRDCWAVVTHSSNCAVEAVCAGIPAFVTGPSAAVPMASTDLTQIESPNLASGRREWAAVLAANQWSVDEMRDGTAWRHLNGVR